MWTFIKNAILHHNTTGAIASSSESLAKAIIEHVDFSKAKQIVELGPGTGALTKRILASMRPDAKLTVIELNKEFCEKLSCIDDARLTVINDDALNIASYIPSADYVFSSIPLTYFSKEKHTKLLGKIKKIAKHRFIQFHYSRLSEKYIRKFFTITNRRFVIRNIPPAFVYCCRK